MRIEKNLSTLNACLFSSASVLCIGVLMQTKNMCMYIQLPKLFAAE